MLAAGLTFHGSPKAGAGSVKRGSRGNNVSRTAPIPSGRIVQRRAGMAKRRHVMSPGKARSSMSAVSCTRSGRPFKTTRMFALMAHSIMDRRNDGLIDTEEQVMNMHSYSAPHAAGNIFLFGANSVGIDRRRGQLGMS